MTTQVASTIKSKKVKTCKIYKSNPEPSASMDDGRNYGVKSLDLSSAAHDSDSDSE